MVYWFITLLVYFSCGFLHHSWNEIIDRNTLLLVCWVAGGFVGWVAGLGWLLAGWLVAGG